MLLESIELQGYKTFAGRTRFEFAGSITCIVGPNGSGKSNIADAIRWVLGEQSYHLLRGKKTEDMIFSGSEIRSRSGMASANITFDNSSGWLPIDYSEVSIARRAYRDGTNEYLLNGQRVRLRDISELLSSSGLSERTYTIIGQGLVDAALALRAEDRRSLFEEAAGIGLYRSRREEAQRRLETTHHNIERVEDILTELRPRLRSLKHQADRVTQYEQVSSDLKTLLREYYGYHWYQVQADLRKARETASIEEKKYETMQQEQAEREGQLDESRDKIHTLRSQLGSWHRESAQLHLQWEEITRHLAVSEERVRSLTAQLQQTEDEITRFEGQAAYTQQQRQETEKAVEQGERELVDALDQREIAKQELQARQIERSAVEERIRKIQESITKLVERERLLKDRQSELLQERERREAARQEAEVKITEVNEEKSQIEKDLKNAIEEIKKISSLRSRAREVLESHILLRIDHVKRFKEAQETRLENHSKMASFIAELNVLENAEKDLAGFGEGTQALLNDGREGKIPGILGALSSQLEVEKELEPAISAALGEYLDSVLIDNREVDRVKDKSLVMALERLLGLDTRGVLIPLADLKPIPAGKMPEIKGVIDLASNLVKVAPEHRPAVDVLLGRTVIVEDREVARKVLLSSSAVDRAVTRSGEVFHTAGIVSVGKKSGSSTLSRPRQRRELEMKISTQEKLMKSIEQRLDSMGAALETIQTQELEFEQKLDDLTQQEAEANNTVRQTETEFNQIRREVKWQQEQKEKLATEIKAVEAEDRKLIQVLDDLQTELSQAQATLQAVLAESKSISTDEQRTQVNYWNTQVALIQASLVNARGKLTERKSAETQADKTRKELETRIIGLIKEMEELEAERVEWRVREGEVTKKMAALTNLIEPTEVKLSQTEEAQNDLEKKEAKAHQGMSAGYRGYSQAQLNLTRTQEHLVRLRDRIEDDLGLVSLEYDEDISGPTPLPLEGLVESLPKMRMLPEDMERTIRRQRAQVKRMGAINPDAQLEYIEVKERYAFLNDQIEDLQKAERDVRQVIAELEEIMQNEFQETFELVATEFKEIFTRLFGGGNARLVLTDPDDLTETGIDIEARLPGRRNQGLSLLSGGERSLTATALVFALLKVSPTPFCVLDEVDAMLDEANVGRFRELLKELAEETQFIVITHNRNTVQVADVIYGVTMGRDSVSQSISLKLDEVAEVV